MSMALLSAWSRNSTGDQRQLLSNSIEPLGTRARLRSFHAGDQRVDCGIERFGMHLPELSTKPRASGNGFGVRAREERGQAIMVPFDSQG